MFIPSKHTFGLLCCFLVVLLAGGRVQAGKMPRSMHLGPAVGGYVFEGDQDIEHGPAFGLRFGVSLTKHWDEELSLFYIDTESDDGGGDIEGYLYRFEGIYNFLPGERITPFTAAGLGGITLDPDHGDSDTRFLVNYGGGLKFALTEEISLRGDVRHVLPLNDLQNNLIYSLGLTYTFGRPEPVRAEAAPADSDGDGIPDAKDRCPNTPAGVSVDATGCPIDSDSDGVADYQDECPRTPPGVTVNDQGCPLDSDNDGVADYEDKCPGTELGVRVGSRGCPPDSDGDGVPDYQDRCPGTPAVAEVDGKGCPLDSDNDGVADYKDKCPRTPGGALVNDFGCWIAGVEFDLDSAAIQERFSANLKEAVDLLRNDPAMKLEIQGHTDSLGSEEYNQELSKRRAEAVKEYFVDHGIDSERLSVVGYGESKPTASNDTAEGRARNRRVQLEPLN